MPHNARGHKGMTRTCGHSSFTADVIQFGKENFNENYRFIITHPHARSRPCYDANGC